MLKRMMMVAPLALAAAVAGSDAAGAQDGGGEVAYLTTYYSDAGQETVVGHLRPQCTRWGVRYTLVGQQSAYSVDEEAFICGPGGPEPL